MQKLVLPVIGVVFLFIVLGILFTNKPAPSTPQDQQTVTSTTTPPEDDNKSSSRYVVHSSGILEKNKGARRVLFFYASWCSTCRPADADLKENADKLPQDSLVIRVNYNDPETDEAEKELAKKYKVTYQHTFVQIDGSGREVAKWNGGKTEELVANLKN